MRNPHNYKELRPIKLYLFGELNEPRSSSEAHIERADIVPSDRIPAVIGNAHKLVATAQSNAVICDRSKGVNSASCSTG